MASEVCKNCHDDLAEIDDGLAAYITDITDDMQAARLFNRCPLCRAKTINVQPATIRRARFLAISAAIIIAYGAWNSVMYREAMQRSENVQLPEAMERIGSINKDMK
ncbi:MAG: hypothetical protein ISQ10_11300 [Planctomycetes bacterium]|nr:hypothetical protein [Planctomycetota bacterium]OUV74624.1 MAG: hypothetical protein CBC98_00765 [Planctomycetaceae bacterium TMED138]HAO72228.1 hypothetical protein [Planctomycetaceae bacterium]HAU49026.1 hypothetical protein [Planctomycetaceae bacterium]|tara:strand:+ start:214 stop:534 length:321 start_codon:yes stop_codon:yes gene_type:complete